MTPRLVHTYIDEVVSTVPLPTETIPIPQTMCELLSAAEAI